MIDAIFIFGAEYVIYLVLILAVLYFFNLSKENRKRFIILAVLTLPIAYVVARIGGYFYFDPRPFVIGNFTPLILHAADNGFPSDHVLLASAVASVFFPFRKVGSAILWLLTLFIGVSRVYAGVHHPIDIIGSIIISAAVTMIVYFTLRRNTNLISIDPPKQIN